MGPTHKHEVPDPRCPGCRGLCPASLPRHRPGCHGGSHQVGLPWLEWPGWLRMRTAINKLHTIRPMIGAIQNQHQAILTLPLLLLLVLTMLTMEPTLEDTEHSDGILTIL